MIYLGIGIVGGELNIALSFVDTVSFPLFKGDIFNRSRTSYLGLIYFIRNFIKN
jgi:hypothetical protein